MHAAPPVRVGLARSRGWIAFGAALAGLASADLVAWGLLQRESSTAVVVLGALVGACAAALGAGLLCWRAQAPLVLRWDGATWLCDDVPGEAQVMLDLDAWMLLRFVPARGGRSARRWIAASRRAADGPWGALRSALYSRRPAAAPDAPSP
jgi:hypothetical protein